MPVGSISEVELLARVGRFDVRREEIAARVEAASAESIAAGLRQNPSISYEREEVFSGAGSTPETFVRLAVPIDVSGRRSRRLRAAEAAIGAARAEGELGLFLLQAEAAEAYRAAAANRARAEILRWSREALAGAAQVIRVRAAAGDASGYDVGRVELELWAWDDLLHDAERELAVARLALGALAGAPGKPLDAADQQPLPPVPSLPTGDAASARGDHRAARGRAAAASLEEAAAQRAWVPTFSLSGGLKTSEAAGQRSSGYVAGVSASVPAFDRGQADLARAVAARRRANAEAQLVEWRTADAVAIAREELVRRVSQATEYEQRQLPAADALVRRASVAYREGERPLFDLLDAHRVGRETRLRALELRTAARQAEVALWRALGRRP